MSRYLEATEDLITVFDQVQTQRFPNLTGINFKLLFDTKKRISKGKLTLASVELVNEKVKHLSANDSYPEGYDYLILVDKVAWDVAKDDDKQRLISHELNHVFIDEKGKYKLVGHDVEDFAAEIERNVDKPNWGRDLVALTSAVHEQAEDQM